MIKNGERTMYPTLNLCALKSKNYIYSILAIHFEKSAKSDGAFHHTDVWSRCWHGLGKSVTTVQNISDNLLVHEAVYNSEQKWYKKRINTLCIL